VSREVKFEDRLKDRDDLAVVLAVAPRALVGVNCGQLAIRTRAVAYRIRSSNLISAG
jgi:hypothetical protein